MWDPPFDRYDCSVGGSAAPDFHSTRISFTHPLKRMLFQMDMVD